MTASTNTSHQWKPYVAIPSLCVCDACSLSFEIWFGVDFLAKNHKMCLQDLSFLWLSAMNVALNLSKGMAENLFRHARNIYSQLN